MANLRLVLGVLFVSGATQIHGDESTATSFVGRLLTPQEGCGTSGKIRVKRFVGGKYAQKDAWPWMALLGYQDSGRFKGFMCGGSLITSKHVLSTAGCMNSSLLFARFGEHDIRTETDGGHLDVPVARWEQHLAFSPELMMNDIGMITLAHDIIFNERIKPVCLPITPELLIQDFTGRNAFVIGWGNTAEGGQQSPILKQLLVPIINKRYCREKFKQIGMLKADYQFSDRVICGYIEGQSSCHGDEGSPLQLPLNVKGMNKEVYYQIGVASWGVGCGRTNLPSVYTNVQYFANWIRSKLH